MILVTGARGQVGLSLQKLADQHPGFSFLFTDSDSLDITRRADVQRFFDKNPVSWCLNCAAYTAVDKAESEPARARAVNALGPRLLAEACAQRGIPMIHLSTDYVYHTRQNTPFREGDPVSPKGVYARTKLAGDRAVLRAHPGGALVIRTSWVYAPWGANFVRTMLRVGPQRGVVGVVFDQVGSPTYAPDLAEAMLRIVEQVDTGKVRLEAAAGLWHYSNEGVTSWYDFALAIFEMSGLNVQVNPIETHEYPTPVARPPYSVLNKKKIKDAFDLEIPHWRDGLRRCLAIFEQ